MVNKKCKTIQRQDNKIASLGLGPKDLYLAAQSWLSLSRDKQTLCMHKEQAGWVALQ